MKLNFKDLKQSKFSIDVEPTESVATVKEKVAAEKGFEAVNMKLIWSGKILADAQEIGSYAIKPSDHIVCMVSKPKASTASTAAKAAPSTPAPAAAAQTPSAPAPAPAPTTGTAPAPATAVVPDTPTPAGTPRQFNDPSAMTLGADREAAISNMEAMGFERAQCERALRAAFFNADRAVEYLLTGIPESAEQQPSRAAPPTQAPTAAATASNIAGEDEEVNLFDAAAAQGGGRGASAQAAGERATSGGGAAAEGVPGSVDASLDFLRNSPTFLGLRQTLQQNPDMLQPVLQQLASSNPALAQQIAQNQEAFLRLLMEDAGEEGGYGMPPGSQAVSVTESERDAIERLTRLGFERDLCIQAYFACDKNEELAANFLFENMDDEGGD